MDNELKNNNGINNQIIDEKLEIPVLAKIKDEDGIYSIKKA